EEPLYDGGLDGGDPFGQDGLSADIEEARIGDSGGSIGEDQALEALRILRREPLSDHAPEREAAIEKALAWCGQQDVFAKLRHRVVAGWSVGGAMSSQIGAQHL